MLIGYARTSTVDQEAGLEAQVRDLRGVAAEKIFTEQVSSVAPRAELMRALEFIREGDTPHRHQTRQTGALSEGPARDRRRCPEEGREPENPGHGPRHLKLSRSA